MKILVMMPLTDAQKRKLEAQAPEAEWRFAWDDGRQECLNDEDVREARIIVGNPPLKQLETAEHLEFLQLISAGAEQYAGKLPERILLSNATGAYGVAISEFMIGMLLMLYKKLDLYYDQFRTETWKKAGTVRGIYGQTALILGMGDIGQETAVRLKAFGAHIIGVRRGNHPKPEYADEAYSTEHLDELLPRADIVAMSLPLTRETEGILSRERIGKMKKGAVLLNAGRGKTVDTEALCDSLESGALGGAALDVTDPEPIPAGHRLWKLRNVLITPHVSGGYNMAETLERITNIAAANIGRVLRGERPENLVDPVLGYKK